MTHLSACRSPSYLIPPYLRRDRNLPIQHCDIILGPAFGLGCLWPESSVDQTQPQLIHASWKTPMNRIASSGNEAIVFDLRLCSPKGNLSTAIEGGQALGVGLPGLSGPFQAGKARNRWSLRGQN